MYEGYIPDITERFPEGFCGVDMTASYFQSEDGVGKKKRYYRKRRKTSRKATKSEEDKKK